MNQEILGIEERLEKLHKSLLKSLKSDKFDEEDYEEETLDEEVEEENPETEKSEDYEEEVADEEPEREENEEEIEEDEDEPEEEEESEEDESVEVDYYELVDKLNESLNIDIINQRLDENEKTFDEIRGQLKEILDIIGDQNYLVNDSVEESGEIKKSLSNIEKNLNKVMKTRKSIKDINVFDKRTNEDQKSDINSLSKSAKSQILADALENGDITITANDVFMAENSGFLNANAKKVIEKAINK